MNYSKPIHIILKLSSLVVVIIMIYSCAKIFHDSINPCSLGDEMECEKWKHDYPNEYRDYLKRIDKEEHKPRLQP